MTSFGETQEFFLGMDEIQGNKNIDSLLNRTASLALLLYSPVWG